MKKITVVGGGTGTFVVLSGLKKYSLDLGVIVSMMDSGGSTGRLRDQLGVLPPGDMRQCLVALSEAPLLWRKLFLYRFEKGDLAGHNFGNIFISVLEKIAKNYDEVVKIASYILKTKGLVIPVTYQKTNLVVKYQNGEVIKGEGLIDQNKNINKKITELLLDPRVSSNPNAIERILKSDLIVIGPGDLYTSIVPIFLVKGIVEAFKKTEAKIVYILNLMTKAGQTHFFTAEDHLKEIEKYLERKVDYIIVNNGRINSKIIKWYHQHNEELVIDDLDNLKTEEKERIKIIRADVVSRRLFHKQKSDVLSRSILRHSSVKLAKIINSLI